MCTCAEAPLFPVFPAPHRKPCTTAVDVWSLGVMMHVLLCGKMPFFGRTELEMKKKIVIGKVALMGPIWRTVRPETTALLKRMLCVRVESRITAAQIVTELDRILAL